MKQQEANKDITVQLNRLRSQQNAIQKRLKNSESVHRAARTRTLIQVGSLVNLVGLLEAFAIEEGDDLQLDFEHKDKAAMLLGFLSDALAEASFTENQKQRWLQKGIRTLKMKTYGKTVV